MVGDFWAILKLINLYKDCCRYYLDNFRKHLGNFLTPTPGHTGQSEIRTKQNRQK